MSELEKKFKKYVKTNYKLISPLWITKYLIKDLAEIAEKEFDGRSFDTFLKIKEENAELKKQIIITKEEGVIVLEGAITLGGDNGLTKYAGKKGKLIFIEDKK